MSGYIYAYFTGDDGHITGRVIILATNDEDAKEQAKQLVEGHPVELWQEGRKIANIRSSKERCRLNSSDERWTLSNLISLSGLRC